MSPLRELIFHLLLVLIGTLLVILPLAMWIRWTRVHGMKDEKWDSRTAAMFMIAGCGVAVVYFLWRWLGAN